MYYPTPQYQKDDVLKISENPRTKPKGDYVKSSTENAEEDILESCLKRTHQTQRKMSLQFPLKRNSLHLIKISASKSEEDVLKISQKSRHCNQKKISSNFPISYGSFHSSLIQKKKNSLKKSAMCL